MSSLFTAVEVALADLGLAKTREQFPDADSLDVVVGGLGLGYTAQAALSDDRLGSLRVVDCLEPVIEWHREGLVPLGPELTADPRCQFVHGDFFQLALADPADTGFRSRRLHEEVPLNPARYRSFSGQVAARGSWRFLFIRRIEKAHSQAPSRRCVCDVVR